MLPRLFWATSHPIFRDVVSNDRVPDFHEEPVSTIGDSTQLTAYMDIATTYDGDSIPRHDH